MTVSVHPVLLGILSLLVIVKASTVSDTDSMIRRGEWWGLSAAPLPSTPGVDVVGKVYHIKQKTSSKYSA